MIFVTLGTQDKQFKRLLIEIERLIKNGKITEPVIAQIGNTKFNTHLDNKQMNLIEFTTQREMQEIIEKANIIITHGGVATIIEGLNKGKKIIAVPRLRKYKEHVNDHQLQIIENFSNSGYIIGTTEVEDLENALEKVNSFVPQKYISNNDKFIQKLMNCIES